MPSDSDQARSEVHCELHLLSKSDPDSSLLIADAGGLPLLVKSLYSTSEDGGGAGTAAQEEAMATVFNISISHRDPSCPPRPYSTRSTSRPRSRLPPPPSTASSSSTPTYPSLALSRSFPPLLRLIQPPNSLARSVKDVLMALFDLALYPLNRPSLIDLGAVPPLFHVFGLDVLVDQLDTATGSTTRVRENAVAALLNLMQLRGEEVEELGRGRSRKGIEEVAKRASAKTKAQAAELLIMLGEKHRSLTANYGPKVSHASTPLSS